MAINSIFSWIVKKRLHQIDLFRKYPIDVQNEMLRKMCYNASYTEFGTQHRFVEVESLKDFQERVPLQSYEELKPWVDRLMAGEKALLWPTESKWYAKSSGTASTKSKLIPMTRESLTDCHQKGGKDLLALYYLNRPDAKLYSYKHVVVGGSAQTIANNFDSYTGDLSAIIMKNLPWWAEIRRTPSKETALMDQWEEKIEKLARETMQENVGMLTGVPSWTMVMGKKILEISGASDLKEIWPNLECFWHGGVSFEPYREEFKKMISGKMNYVESYNASEGFFGIQDDLGKDDLLLMLDYGIFYEFIPMDCYEGVDSKKVIGLEDIELGKNYALVISTNGGLWRYIIGDTVKFTSKAPFRFKITGRTKSYINTFGEELIVENADQAVTWACSELGAQIRDYTACPIYMENNSKGGHEWLFEFVRPPADMNVFMNLIDQKLQEINGDYEAKRQKGMAMGFPKYSVLATGGFDQWLKSQGKLGGQNKIPRLCNDRYIVEQILQQQTQKQFV